MRGLKSPAVTWSNTYFTALAFSSGTESISRTVYPRTVSPLLSAAYNGNGVGSGANAPYSKMVPSYAAASKDQAVRGIVASYDGKYVLQVRDRAGYLDNVRLHQGTIINPTGLPLQNGMRVVVFGYNAGHLRLGGLELLNP